MPREPIGVDVLTVAKQRISLAFNDFEKICISFSGGKDSSAMLHLVMQEAMKRNRKVAVLFIDFEAQYKATIQHIEECFSAYERWIEPFWVALPIHLRNAVSVYEPFWLCWDEDKEPAWVRRPSKRSITDTKFFPFFEPGMEFEEFIPLFSEWYAQGTPTAFFVGIRAQESYNRYLTIASGHKTMYQGHRYTTGVTDNSSSFNFYPLYDWKTEDIWRFFATDTSMSVNSTYERMRLAGLSLPQMRLCQPYGDDQRKGLWLFHLLEPETWARVVARVSGANSGSLYCGETGNITGYRKISKPPNMTWLQFVKQLVFSMPEKSKDHYIGKIKVFAGWWMARGYPEGLPDQADYDLEIAKKAPSWRRVAKAILRNDYFCKGLGFVQPKSEAYKRFLGIKKVKEEIEPSMIYHTSTLPPTLGAPLALFTCSNGVAFQHDLMSLAQLPVAYESADVLYVEPPWRRGLHIFSERSGVQVNFQKLMQRIEQLVLKSGKPAIVITGKDGAKFLLCETARCEVLLLGPKTPAPALAIGYGLRPNFRTTNEIKEKLASEFSCLGDFCCGYGSAPMAFVRAGKQFVASDSDASAIGVFHKTYYDFVL